MRHGIVPAKAAALRRAWAAAGRAGGPDIRVQVSARPSPEELAAWANAGASELVWGVPDDPADAVEAYLDRLAGRLGLGQGEH